MQLRGTVFSGVCLFVCFSARYLKIDAARITKLDIEIFHQESWKPIYFKVKRSKVKVTRHTSLVFVCIILYYSVLPLKVNKVVQKHNRRRFLQSRECWLFLVTGNFTAK